MLVYALSTMAMNHRQFFTKRGDNPIRFEKESEQTYTGIFPLQATARQMALQLLKGLNLEGTFSVLHSKLPRSLFQISSPSNSVLHLHASTNET